MTDRMTEKEIDALCEALGCETNYTDDLHRKALTAIRQLQQPWREIESAPRDGTLFLMRNANYHSFGVWPAQRWVTYEYSTEIGDFIARDRGAWLHAFSIEPDYDEGHTTGSVAEMPISVAPDEFNTSVRYEWQPMPAPLPTPPETER